MYNLFSFLITFVISFAAIYSYFNALIPFVACLGVLIVTFLLLFLFHLKQDVFFREYQPRLEEIQENINMLREENGNKENALSILPHKAENLTSISRIVDRLTRLMEKEKIYDYLFVQLARLLPQSDNILLFIFNRQTNLIDLVYSHKKEPLVIKEKHGDFTEWWVLRHNQSLLIDDFTEDFRFDCSISPAYQERGIRSFIASPISQGDTVIGVVRAESRGKTAFSLDDLRVLRILSDVTAAVLERARIFQRVKELATKDALTDLFLRDAFLYRLKEELTRAQMNSSQLALGVLDIDDFKKINDTYGHTVGDLVLKKTARVLSQVVGDSGNMAARYGGEEFVFFLVRSEKEAAFALAEKIRKELSQVIISFRRRKIHFTASLGLAFYPDDGSSFIALMDKADNLLYRAKKEGKNKVCSTS